MSGSYFFILIWKKVKDFGGISLDWGNTAQADMTSQDGQQRLAEDCQILLVTLKSLHSAGIQAFAEGWSQLPPFNKKSLQSIV